MDKETEKAFEPIRELFSDTSVSIETTRDRLEEIASEIEIMLTSLTGE